MARVSFRGKGWTIRLGRGGLDREIPSWFRPHAALRLLPVLYASPMQVFPGWMLQLLCGLRWRLLLLVLLTCAPLIVLTVHKAGEDRRRQEAAWCRESLRLTELAGREEHQLIGQTRQLLLAVAESGHVRTGDRRSAKKLMDELLSLFVFRPFN